jgi:SPP1 gp7 family putative phage head morphogenesis protein
VLTPREQTISEIRLRKKLGLKKPRRRLPRQIPPKLIEVEYANGITAVLSQARAVAETVARRWVKTRADSPTSDDYDKETAKFFEQFRPKEAEALAKKFATRVVKHSDDQLKKQAKAALGVDIFTSESGITQLVEPFVTENVALIRSVPKKYFDDVEVMVARAVAEGQRWEDLAVDFEDKFKIAKSRAELIAVDQVGKLYGNVQQLRQEQLGVDRYTRRTVHDNRVRPEHAALDGKMFYWAKPPAEGHPGQAIRCFPGDMKVSPSALIRKLYRRRYRGHLTTLITDQGKPLRATPNHPILTTRGWVPAQFVDVGDYLIEACDEGVDLCVEDLKSMETMFVELFRAAQDLGTSALADASRAWFHGDISDEDVDVVLVNWDLAVEGVTTLSQESCEKFLTLADDPTLCLGPAAQLFGANLVATQSSIRGCCKLLALIWGQGDVSGKHALTEISRLYTLANQLSADGATRDAELLRQTLDTATRNPEVTKSLARVVFSIGCRVIPPRRDTSLSQFQAEKIGVDADVLGNLFDSETFVKQGRRVIKKTVGEFASTHVYNVETDTGWYVTQGVIVHNCRCQAEPDFSALLGE